MPLNIKIRYFASIRESIGISEEIMEIINPISLNELRELLIGQGAGYAEALAHKRTVRCAVNQNMVSGTEILTNSCEVAFFPPVTGG
ncbi:MAG: molybdopterin converting factor subunit 1 [Burkholderiaceae bacterium]